MKLDRVLDVLRQLAPEHLADSWDRVGLHVGDAAWPVRCAMLCIDVTATVLDEAINRRVQLLVAYHPPIFEPLKAVTVGDPKQHLILRAIQARIAIYSPHTALDAAAGGVNDWFCEGITPGTAGDTVRPIRPFVAPSTGVSPRLFKIVTFVPPQYLASLRWALWSAGAGRTGGYSECSFSVEGEGTFRGGRSTHPAIGRPGHLETVRERRLEIIVPASRLPEAVAALRGTHPYEEPAFDLVALEPDPSLHPDNGPGGSRVPEGQGRIVTLRRPMSIPTLVGRVRRHLGVRAVEVATAAPLENVRPLRRIGVCAGAGGSLLKEAMPLDAFVTGEMRHHDVLDAIARGVTVILAGHTQTERPYLPFYRQRISKLLGKQVIWHISRADRPPLVRRAAQRS